MHSDTLHYSIAYIHLYFFNNSYGYKSITNLRKTKDLLCLLVFDKMSFLIHFILAFLAGIIFPANYTDTLTKITFCIPNTNCRGAINLHTYVLMFGKISFLIHFILAFLTGIVFTINFLGIYLKKS